MNISSMFERLAAVSPAFIDAAIRGAAILLIALGLTQLLRRRSAAARHLVWVGAIVVQLALPLFAIWGPKWDLALPGGVASVLPFELPVAGVKALPSIEGAPTAGAPTAGGTAGGITAPKIEGAPVRSETQPSIPATHAEETTRPSAPIRGRTLLLALWLAGAVVIFARLAIGTTIVARLARGGNRIDDGSWLSLAQRVSTSLKIERPLTLLRGTKLGVPVTWGIVYPVVLLPDDADTWPEDRRRFVLVHEMAHVKRFDALTQLAGQMALALFWFDPLVWIANRRMQLEREHACDDYVLRAGTAASTYAEELLTMVRSLGTPEHRSTQPAFAALAMARRSEFEGRMLSILDPVLDRHPLSTGRAFVSALAALLLVVPLAAMHPSQRARQDAVARASVATAAGVPLNARTAVVQARQSSVDSAAEFAKARAKDVGEFPESFKVRFSPAGTATVTPAAPRSSETEIVSGRAVTCDNIDFSRTSTGSSTHIDAHDDDGSAVINYVRYNSAKCLSASIIGRPKYTEAEDDIVEMPAGSRASFRERIANGTDRELTLTRGADGAVGRSYRRDGADAEFDEGARHWFAEYLPMVLMETGVNVGPRVARWRAQGGVDNALARIAEMNSSGARRSHYEALIRSGTLSGEELDRLVRSASESMRSSSGDLRAILTEAAPRVRLSKKTLPAMESAIESMASSGDRTAVLQMYGETDDHLMLLMVMRAAEGIASSGDLARLLQVLAPRYLKDGDRVLASSYFDHARQIPSSGDLQNVLASAVPYAAHWTDIAGMVINAVRGMPSSGDRSRVLITLWESGAVGTKGLRDAFYAAAEELPSEGDKRRVLQVAARQ